MRIFKNAWFECFARKQCIPDKALLEAIERAEKGQIDANLGGGVIKQRVARKGQDKSGGFRAIILYHAAGRAFFVWALPRASATTSMMTRKHSSRMQLPMSWD